MNAYDALTILTLTLAAIIKSLFAWPTLLVALVAGVCLLAIGDWPALVVLGLAILMFFVALGMGDDPQH